MESTNFINHKGKLSDFLNVCRVPSTVLRFYKYVILDFSPQPYKVGTIVRPIYQIKKLRLREGNRLVREQAVSKKQTSGLDSLCSFTRSCCPSKEESSRINYLSAQKRCLCLRADSVKKGPRTSLRITFAPLIFFSLFQ